MASSDTIETAALGRPFQLGMLYDCRKDVLIPGVILWDQEELQKNKTVQQQNSAEFDINASDSIEDKSSSLKISDSLKLSLLGGLVNVGGSAKYFQDTKKSQKQIRVTLQYKTTTRFETLGKTHLAHGQGSHVFEDNTATHVVTAILYGAAAYFVFDRESSSEEDRKKVEMEANLTYNKLKYLTVDAETSFNLDDKEKAAVEKLSCTFHGDFKLPTNPTSFRDAVKVYRELPKLLGENGEHAVPLRVWLYPLCKLDSRAAKLERGICNSLLKYSSDIMESLTKTEMRGNDLLKETAVATFSAMKEKVQDFIYNCHHYKLDFMQKIGSVLPSIRGGWQDESALLDILKAHEESPFNNKDLDQWLTNKERESEMLKTFLKQLVKLGVSMDENVDDLLFEVRNVVCFSFTSLDQPDQFIVKLSNYLKPSGLMESSTESGQLQQTGNTEWFSSDAKQMMRTQFKLFKKLKSMSPTDNTKFISISKYDTNHPGACIVIYEDGYDPVYFVPPTKPAPLATTDTSHDSIRVQASERDSATVEFRVEYREKQNQENEWKSQPAQKNQKAVTLSGLKPETQYEIRATAVGKLNYTVSSDVCSALTLAAVSPPTQVETDKVKATSITLKWSNPCVQKCQSLKQYIIEFREENSNQWQSMKTGREVYTFTLENLKQNTSYSFRMCTDTGVGVSQPSMELKCRTMKAWQDPTKIISLQDDPPVYLLKPTQMCHSSQKVYGSMLRNKQLKKTIMVVGATGSGKTTLVNGMINYILGVEWEDKHRFKLIDEQTQQSQACSQTSEVTAYHIYHTDGFQVPYSLTIIDTPGFGDTRGIKQDKEITEKIRSFFSAKSGIDSIDAVCFVVQSALARLTHTQKYIFDAILSIFGKDIATNIIALVTFADGKEPPVLEAIKAANIPCASNPDGSPLHFKFNNSVLFTKNPGVSNDEDNFDYMFWKMGKASLNKFFNHLTSMQPRSLTLTKEVLQERRQLETTVEGLQPMIRQGLSKLEEINTTKAVLQSNETHIKENKDFEYEVEVDKSEKIDIPSGQFITNCHGCNYTCHYPCMIPKDNEKMGCSAMKNGSCKVCPGKCVWSAHFNMTYRWDIKRETEKRTYQELKSKYEAALGKKMNMEKIVKQLELEYEQVQGKVIEIMNTVTKCLKRLSEIALRPDPLSTPDYIDLLIQSEEHEAKPGFKERIKELQEVRQGAVLLQKVAEKVALTGKEKSKWQKMKSTAKGVFIDLWAQLT